MVGGVVVGSGARRVAHVLRQTFDQAAVSHGLDAQQVDDLPHGDVLSAHLAEPGDVALPCNHSDQSRNRRRARRSAESDLPTTTMSRYSISSVSRFHCTSSSCERSRSAADQDASCLIPPMSPSHLVFARTASVEIVEELEPQQDQHQEVVGLHFGSSYLETWRKMRRRRRPDDCGGNVWHQPEASARLCRTSRPCTSRPGSSRSDRRQSSHFHIPELFLCLLTLREPYIPTSASVSSPCVQSVFPFYVVFCGCVTDIEWISLPQQLQHNQHPSLFQS